MRIVAVFIALLPGFMKNIVLRTFFHADIADNVRIGFGSVVLADRIKLQNGARIGMFTYIRVYDLQMGAHANIGNRSFISLHTLRMGPRSTLASQVTVAGEHSENGILEMGMYSWIFQYCYINAARPISLGKNVGVGGGTYIFTHGYWLSKLDGYPVSYGGVSIGDDTWLPWGCFIMPGVSIGKEVVVGARSLVTRSVPDHALVAGSPAKIVRERSNKILSLEERGEILNELMHDYAAHIKQVLTVDGSGIDIVYRFSSGFVVNLCGEQDSLRHGLFNICWSQVDDALFYLEQVWSLLDYKSSPESSFPSDAINFLKFGRNIGLRYYPVDEL